MRDVEVGRIHRFASVRRLGWGTFCARFQSAAFDRNKTLNDKRGLCAFIHSLIPSSSGGSSILAAQGLSYQGLMESNDPPRKSFLPTLQYVCGRLASLLP